MTTIRNTIRYAAAGLLLAGVMAPAYAQQDPRLVGTGQVGAGKAPRTSASQRAPQAAQDSSRRICVRTQLSGSRINREICHTQAEWDRMGGLPE